MAKKQQNDKQETVNKEFSLKDLSSKSLSELLELKTAAEFLIEYYDNYSKANTGTYPYDTEEIYRTAKDLCEKYHKGLMNVLHTIENKIKEELFN